MTPKVSNSFFVDDRSMASEPTGGYPIILRCPSPTRSPRDSKTTTLPKNSCIGSDTATCRRCWRVVGTEQKSSIGASRKKTRKPSRFDIDSRIGRRSSDTLSITHPVSAMRGPNDSPRVEASRSAAPSARSCSRSTSESRPREQALRRIYLVNRRTRRPTRELDI